MKVYIVGGAVRDALLGLPVKDRDHVVVGATPEQMLEQGFRPVGRDFPVFLHPDTQEEYALARTERKSGHGYTGFVVHASPEVTLEEDLRRRDLTINAMARDADGTLIDPYGGQADLAARRFRHVSPAFAEDPVRILRVARFAARFEAFTVADETLALMRAMVAAGEVDHLVPERVWQELARGLMEMAPMRMIAVLVACGALARILPELVAGLARSEDALQRSLNCAVDRALTLEQRWALLFGADEAGAAQASERLRAPQQCRDVSVLLARLGASLAQADDAPARLAVLSACDAFRRPERFLSVLDAAACRSDLAPVDAATWRRVLAAARAVDGGAVARQAADRSAIPAAIEAARLAAIATAG
ncbi:multifunctional CCA tRNA nucleotidyl transferase/2'3'-cyclic phosphodiesterase/2'nucleotidase/phosphatase [Nitrogeniibacter mangrovi]|uniref:Multifunctional CCA tRNA nucleotidyl transferase/2'3'-cyclic phosphodiesterase/2'nucleotidase/phosphatase n=1 Tax=Nitrogeniibacter mangrovi TaxID=2016596 RepID=A0A6C1B2R0_9RHOO|nr:multifunctional CCA tRNA nucleotidyl transferase/2'3'-cyclic phosphodiesterase/2'nucleotidase/phosphatase [Nitrogeniibacter mangrovi]QID16494.1 multifunctional CCA tRNA nucleotidyl transferase/2'3'-cyclic phosphodiesterase/2'nucleotidase/phosphatase [Nitrogeniibacter mangrovi]